MHASDSHLRPHNALLAAALLSKSETIQDDSLRDFAASLARYPIPILHPSAAVCVCHSSVAHLDYLREAIQTVYQNTPTREEFLKQASPFRFVASDTYREWLRGEYEKSEHHHHHKDSRYVPMDFFCHGWKKEKKERRNNIGQKRMRSRSVSATAEEKRSATPNRDPHPNNNTSKDIFTSLRFTDNNNNKENKNDLSLRVYENESLLNELNMNHNSNSNLEVLNNNNNFIQNISLIGDSKVSDNSLFANLQHNNNNNENSNLEKLKSSDLKDICKRNHLSVKGNKSELIQRIEQFHHNNNNHRSVSPPPRVPHASSPVDRGNTPHHNIKETSPEVVAHSFLELSQKKCNTPNMNKHHNSKSASPPRTIFTWSNNNNNIHHGEKSTSPPPLTCPTVNQNTIPNRNHHNTVGYNLCNMDNDRIIPPPNLFAKQGRKNKVQANPNESKLSNHHHNSNNNNNSVERDDFDSLFGLESIEMMSAIVEKNNHSLNNSDRRSHTEMETTNLSTNNNNNRFICQLVVDHRERIHKKHENILQIFSKLNTNSNAIQIISETLLCGDYALRLVDQHDQTNYTISLAVERKTLADLCGSTVDGRYYSQRHFLSLSPYQQILWVIEDGPLAQGKRYPVRGAPYPPAAAAANHTEVLWTRIHSAVSSLALQVAPGVTVLRTRSCQETAAVLLALGERLVTYYNRTAAPTALLPTAALLRYIDRLQSHVQGQSLLVRMLTRVRGMRAPLAVWLTVKYRTLLGLYEAAGGGQSSVGLEGTIQEASTAQRKVLVLLSEFLTAKEYF